MQHSNFVNYLRAINEIDKEAKLPEPQRIQRQQEREQVKTPAGIEMAKQKEEDAWVVLQEFSTKMYEWQKWKESEPFVPIPDWGNPMPKIQSSWVKLRAHLYFVKAWEDWRVTEPSIHKTMQTNHHE